VSDPQIAGGSDFVNGMRFTPDGIQRRLGERKEVGSPLPRDPL